MNRESQATSVWYASRGQARTDEDILTAIAEALGQVSQTDA
jgi:hypothetical protein